MYRWMSENDIHEAVTAILERSWKLGPPPIGSQRSPLTPRALTSRSPHSIVVTKFIELLLANDLKYIKRTSHCSYLAIEIGPGGAGTSVVPPRRAARARVVSPTSGTADGPGRADCDLEPPVG